MSSDLTRLAEGILQLVAVVLGVEDHRVSVLLQNRISDKTGLPELACEIRLDGEIITGEDERLVQEVLNKAAAAAAVVTEARQEGVSVTPGKKTA